MALVNYTSRNFKLYFKKQAVFGTAESLSSSGWQELYTEAMPKIEGDVSHEDLMLSNTTRIMKNDSLYTSTDNSTPTLEFSTHLRFWNASHLFAALMQTYLPENVQFDDTRYYHQWALHDTQPDYTVNAGYFYTIVLKDIMTGQDQVMHSCIISKGSLNVKPQAKGKENLVTFSGTWWSPFPVLRNQTFTGTLTAPINPIPAPFPNRLYTSLWYAVDGGATLPIRTLKIDIDNKASVIARGQIAKTIGLQIPFGEVKLSVTFYYNNDTKNYLSQMQNGTEKLLLLESSIPSASEVLGELYINVNGRIVNDPLADDGGNAVLNLEMNLMRSSDGNQPPILITNMDGYNIF